MGPLSSDASILVEREDLIANHEKSRFFMVAGTATGLAVACLALLSINYYTAQTSTTSMLVSSLSTATNPITRNSNPLATPRAQLWQSHGISLPSQTHSGAVRGHEFHSVDMLDGVQLHGSNGLTQDSRPKKFSVQPSDSIASSFHADIPALLSIFGVLLGGAIYAMRRSTYSSIPGPASDVEAPQWAMGALSGRHDVSTPPAGTFGSLATKPSERHESKIHAQKKKKKNVLQKYLNDEEGEDEDDDDDYSPTVTAGANMVWLDVGVTVDDFKEKPIKTFILEGNRKAYVIYQVEGAKNSKYYCSDASSTAYQYPLSDAKIIFGQDGAPWIKVPLDGTVYDMATGKVLEWCPQNNMMRKFLGGLKKNSQPVDLPVYKTKIEGKKIMVYI